MSRKRTLDGFFAPAEAKKPKIEIPEEVSDHPSYPFPIRHLPAVIADGLGFAPSSEGREINDQSDLDLLYFEPYVPKDIHRELFKFLRQELFFYRVQYHIKRGPVETQINTPRWTTVFGVDETCSFGADGNLLDSKTRQPVARDKYKCKPRPIPHCLDTLRTITEGTTGETFNFCLVNYYATGNDSISYHSDDERFLGPNPAIASFALGAKRDLLMRHKPKPPSEAAPATPEAKTIKLPLASGDMVLMRGPTQANWLHSIPKRKGRDSDKGRINITFRKAMVKGGTENYYQYNVGTGGVFRWDEKKQEMTPWPAS
ncbi:uncharacterized protein BDZ99DRAFT_465762 [Mytilinidion resinicola]|uniref:Fe2OG dioxygenase domain-containing protein n=1 Tax=Mytilinidion resinicola TaxID=574789 RepID=A0A6A6YDX2_9PEZI|nr:uncharacterized protein BDZ99DRAFT_465762 [Mytilinidion resinicola]KAF2807021.1 hypothetical protein BDZ99DRAFT_465762 [Mytilinidion resinicola]